MKGMARTGVLTLLLSIALGLSSYGLTLLLLLPVTDASDGEGHGPDRDTPEWHHAIDRQTERRHGWASNLGIGVGAVSLPIAFCLMRRRQNL